MADLCPGCGLGFAPQEPFVRTDTVTRLADLPFEVLAQTLKVGFFHLACAPWEDPRYRIGRMQRQPI
jgi:hypothetical protein